MYSVDSLKYAIRGLYRSGIGEHSGLPADEVEEFLDGIDFHALLQAVLTTRSVELWLLEDMTITAVASVSVVCEGGAYVAEYREGLGDPWTSGMCLDLEELTDRLDKLCWPVHEHEIPVYEL